MSEDSTFPQCISVRNALGKDCPFPTAPTPPHSAPTGKPAKPKQGGLDGLTWHVVSEEWEGKPKGSCWEWNLKMILSPSDSDRLRFLLKIWIWAPTGSSGVFSNVRK